MRYISLIANDPQSLGDIIQFLMQQSGKSETDLGKLIGATQPMINKAKLNQKALPSSTIDVIGKVFGLNKEERELLTWLNLRAKICAKRRDGGDMLVEHYETELKQAQALVATLKDQCLQIADAVIESPDDCAKRAVKLAHLFKKTFAPEV